MVVARQSVISESGHEREKDERERGKNKREDRKGYCRGFSH